ncbi:helix-turn-helix transcriptional regulator [Pseudohalocynthiibacter aestuariivivens]|jgi:DNA-binding CsgD family transcriptional regulator|uniref:Helix-turn-helix transcriptional regulator n=1 Tax=Pseudohalocynthiibacter aestuariivivens TaxID=1591409 RepID=A0ABV5JGZ9_9RHOB|nr:MULTISPECIES: LuxR family transcriptional regulator [Pseudohalocynthiibacter]MBS9718430.1 helix-turn-helix transcriptional regulator [Pseudohalocynthiibacter aestuariivivens]MCK0104103.1 LuxR C-terminal-related transcriptional regulator [Pseudohalocynthiibacter sp. F2068]
MENWTKATGVVIEAVGTEDFAKSLSAALKGIVPFDFTVIFGYLGAARPIDLFDDFPRKKRKIFVEDYQEGPYLLDPFYLACENKVEPGLYRIRDLAPDRFFQGEYFRSYYMRTGLAEEIGFFIELPDKSIAVVSLMRAEKPFTQKEVRQLRQFWPIVRALCRCHWSDLSARSVEGEHAVANSRIHQSVELAFLNLGEGVLTPRERQVVEYTLKGHSADAVGRILEISPGTVRIHRRNVYSKLRIRSQGELFSKFIKTLIAEPVG